VKNDSRLFDESDAAGVPQEEEPEAETLEMTFRFLLP
jgi:hypothetical protein